MNVRPGKGLLAAGGAALGIGALAFVWSGAPWLLLPLGLLAVGGSAFDFLALRRLRAGLGVERELPKAVGRGSHFESVIVLTNASNTAFGGALREVRPAQAAPEWSVLPVELAAGASVRLATQLSIGVRGKHSFSQLWLRSTGPLRMLEGVWCEERPAELKVLPATALSGDALTRDERAEMLALQKSSRNRLRGDGFEFESLSEFREGDDPRRIDWKTSARMRAPVVRRYQVEQHRDVFIALDCGRLMGIAADTGTKLDRAVDSALMLANVAIGKGDRCGLGVFDDRMLGFLPPQAGAVGSRAILESLYNVQSRMRESNFGAMFAQLQSRQQKRALVVILSDLVDEESSEQFRGAMAALARRHVVLFAALRTPLMTSILNEPVDSADDLLRKGVTLRLLRARERALHTLDHTGVHILDVEPRHLTVPLVNRYVNLREGSL